MPEDLSNSYKIRPNFKHKFRPAAVKTVIHDVLNEELSGKKYNSEEATSWCKHISDTVKEKLKELELDRYKFMVQVVIGEQRGEGVKVACRCLWDSDTDNYAQDVFMNAYVSYSITKTNDGGVVVCTWQDTTFTYTMLSPSPPWRTQEYNFTYELDKRPGHITIMSIEVATSQYFES